MRRDDLPDLLYNVLDELGGEATAVEAAAWFWSRYDEELRSSGNLYYTWEFDLEKAVGDLRRDHRMVEAYYSPGDVWELVG